MKRIFTTLSQKWPEYLLELIVITSGVLGAFMLNGWKEGLDNRGEERRILSGLKEEFEVNLSEVNRNIELNTSSVESSISLIDLIRSEHPFTNPNYVDSLMYVAYMFGTFDAQTGLVDEVIGSGKLSVLKDAQLRNSLTSVSGILDNAEEDYKVRVDYYMHQIIPFLSQYFPLANFDKHMDFSSWSKNYRQRKVAQSPLKAKYNQVDLLHLENLVYQHKLNNDFVNLNEYEMRAFFVKTLEIINDNLESKE